MKRRISILVPCLAVFTAIVVSLVSAIMFRGENPSLVLILNLASLLLLMFGIALFIWRIYLPVRTLANKLLNLHKGEVPEVDSHKMNNELGDIEKSLREHFAYLAKMIRFTHDISRGEAGDDLEIRSENDRIGQALTELRDQLRKTRIQEEKRRSHDEQLNWASKGLASIGELLRNTEEDIHLMSNEFIKALVKYLDMEVGGFYIMHDEDIDEPELQLTGSYAFDRQKQLDKNFKPGEGLVGRCAVEKESILITDVPEDYIKIRSGMGEDKPATIILVPVKMDEYILGVIELATFSEVPDYKIKFIESLSNSIAASVTKVKVNIQTAKLLKQSR